MEGDTLITIAVIILAAGLMILFPVMTMADRTDDVTQLVIESAVTEFANDVRTTGKLTLDKYDKLVETLASTGNSYEVEMERQVQDENVAKKLAQAQTDKHGENVSYSVFTEQILDELDKEGQIDFNEGDRFVVSVKSTNQTIGDQLNNWLYSISGNENYSHGAREAVMITK